MYIKSCKCNRTFNNSTMRSDSVNGPYWVECSNCGNKVLEKKESEDAAAQEWNQSQHKAVKKIPDDN